MKTTLFLGLVLTCVQPAPVVNNVMFTQTSLDKANESQKKFYNKIKSQDTTKQLWLVKFNPDTLKAKEVTLTDLKDIPAIKMSGFRLKEKDFPSDPPTKMNSFYWHELPAKNEPTDVIFNYVDTSSGYGAVFVANKNRTCQYTIQPVGGGLYVFVDVDHSKFGPD